MHIINASFGTQDKTQIKLVSFFSIKINQQGCPEGGHDEAFPPWLLRIILSIGKNLYKCIIIKNVDDFSFFCLFETL